MDDDSRTGSFSHGTAKNQNRPTSALSQAAQTMLRRAQDEEGQSVLLQSCALSHGAKGADTRPLYAPRAHYQSRRRGSDPSIRRVRCEEEHVLVDRSDTEDVVSTSASSQSGWASSFTASSASSSTPSPAESSRTHRRRRRDDAVSPSLTTRTSRYANTDESTSSQSPETPQLSPSSTSRSLRPHYSEETPRTPVEGSPIPSRSPRRPMTGCHDMSQEDINDFLKRMLTPGEEPPATPGASGRQESQLLGRRRNRKPNLNTLVIEPSAISAIKQEERIAKRSIRVLEPREKIFDLYYWSEVLQEEGCGGKVVVCSPKETSGERSPLISPGLSPMTASTPAVVGTHVMKMKAKTELGKQHGAEQQFRKSHLLMLNLPPHKGVLPLHEVLEDDAFYYVVMGKATGGSLLSNLAAQYSDGEMPERAIKELMRDMLLAIGHLHHHGMLHRDVKIDNFVVQVYDNATTPGHKIKNVQLIDFDLADADGCESAKTPWKQGNGWVGTMRNSAPETFWGNFSQRSDLYGVGTILYLIMAGKMPYDDKFFDQCGKRTEDMHDLCCKLAHVPVDWDAHCWQKFPMCKDFCMSLLAFNPQSRPASAEDALKHEWFLGGLGRHVGG